MAHYFLPQHVHACFAAGRTIFLDMKRGTYFGLDPEKTESLRHVLDGSAPAEEAAIAAELIGMGLLTTSRNASKTFLPPAASAPETALLPLIDDRPRITAARAVRFLATCSTVALRLKLRPLERSLAHLALRKARCTARFIADDATLAKARDLTRTFFHLRPLAYAARNRCLLDSLTLAEFLAGYGIRATCIFAVRADPFEAHCWVQIGEHILNETPEMARRYTPILSV